MDTHHLIDGWTAELASNSTRPRVFNHNLRLHPGSFKGFELVNTVAMDAPSGGTETVYLFAGRATKNAKEELLLRVGVSTHDDARGALLALGQTLDNCMNPEIPRVEPGKGKLGKLVDIGFALRGADEAGRATGKGLAAATFTLGNTLVTLHSVGSSVVDVASVAAQLGQWLAGAPDTKRIQGGQATAFAPRHVQLKAGQALTLVEQLPGPGATAARIQVLARGGELRRVGAALVFVAGASGTQDVALYSHAAPGL